MFFVNLYDLVSNVSKEDKIQVLLKGNVVGQAPPNYEVSDWDPATPLEAGSRHMQVLPGSENKNEKEEKEV